MLTQIGGEILKFFCLRETLGCQCLKIVRVRDGGVMSLVLGGEEIIWWELRVF